MYEIANFEEYTLRKYLGPVPVLTWSKKNGYQFLSFIDRMKAVAEGLDFKIIGVPKEN